jgi:farnesyl diphosphate synthase
MPEPLDFKPWMQSICQHMEVALERALPESSTVPTILHEAMRYAVVGGGKRIRPLLCYAAGELVGAAPQMLDIPAVALELIHAYSLVHDDLPAMDNDDWRRGQPTVHRRYGEAIAVLVGDALQAQAFIVLTHHNPRGGAVSLSHERSDAAHDILDAHRQAQWVRELAWASGSLGMAGGQALDLSSVGLTLPRAQLETMHRLKTGALIEAAVRMGAHAGPTPIEPELETALGVYARAIGLAFQVVDDLLDATATASTLGKTPGKDALQAKPTYVSMLGLEASHALAQELRIEAHLALERLGHRADRLAQLADWVVERVS